MGLSIKAQACVSAKCSRGSTFPQRLAPCPNNHSQAGGSTTKEEKKKERKNIFSSLSNLHDAEAEVKLEASCLELSHAKIAFFGENSLANDCFAVRDINPCRITIVLSLCSTAPLFFPQFILVDFFFMCVTKG